MSENSDSKISWDNIDKIEREHNEDIYSISNYFPSSQITKNISEENWQIVELSSLTSTVDSYGFYPEISASSNPASNPTPSVYSMLTEDQKLIKLLNVMDQINKEGKYLWYVEKDPNNVKQFAYSFIITDLELLNHNVIYCEVISCSNLITIYYYFNCKDVDKDLFEKIVPLIHHKAALWFFNINHMTRNDINILDSIFAEHFMSNYQTTLYNPYLVFYPEKRNNKNINKLSNQIFLPSFINWLSSNFMKDRIWIIVRYMMLTYDELITFLLSLQSPKVQFNNCLILINKCLTNKLKRSITQKWEFYEWKFESQTSIDGRISFIYSISQNPYFFKSLTNFEITGTDGFRSMFGSFITSYKSRSLIYRFMLTRLKELARSKVLNYKYDDQDSFLKIDIWENYNFWWIVNKDMNIVINFDVWKFILAKIWSSLYNYFLLHRWFIPSQLERRIKLMIKYMNNYKHSKSIKFHYVMFKNKFSSQKLIDTIFNLIARSSFSEICLHISYSDISNCIGATFSKIIKLHSSSVQKIIIFNWNTFDFINWENPSSMDQIKVMIDEYGVNYHTYVFYKFLENSRLLDSVKEIEFFDSLNIDFTYLESLILKYQSKHNIQWGISFLLRSYSGSIMDSNIMVNLYFYSLVSHLIQFVQSY